MIKKLGNPNLIDSLLNLIYYLFMKEYFKFIQKWHLLILLVVLVTIMTKPITSAYSQDNVPNCSSEVEFTLSIAPEATSLVATVETIVGRIPPISWSVPGNCKPPELNRDSTAFLNDNEDTNKICVFYNCANSSVVQKGICEPGDPKAYLLNYGEKYCHLFRDKTRPNLSEESKIWLNKTLVCLQQSIINFCKIGTRCNTCDRITSGAFASHPSCYTNSGLCELVASHLHDVARIALTVESVDIIDMYYNDDTVQSVEFNKKALQQIKDVAGTCTREIPRQAIRAVRGIARRVLLSIDGADLE